MSRLVVGIYRLSHALHRLGVPFLPLLVMLASRILFSCVICPGARIGRRLSLGYGGLGIVIHGRAVIGDDAWIAAGVIIGGRSKLWEVPVLGDRVVVGTGAKILGPVRIGDEAVIGANAVVVHDVPARSIVAGVPARIVKREIDIRDYHDGLVGLAPVQRATHEKTHVDVLESSAATHPGAVCARDDSLVVEESCSPR